MTPKRYHEAPLVPKMPLSLVDKLGKSLHRLEELIMGWAEQIAVLPKRVA